MAHTPGHEPQPQRAAGNPEYDSIPVGGPRAKRQPVGQGHDVTDQSLRSGDEGGPTGFAPRIGDIVTSLKTDGTRLLNDNVALAKAEITPMAKHAGIGAGLFSGAGYFAMCALALLGMAGGFAFSQMWQSIFSGLGNLTALALGYLTMALVLLILAGVLAMIGKNQVGKVSKPEATIEEFKNSVAVLGDSVKRGQQTVKVNSLDRSGLRDDRKEVAKFEKEAEQAHRDAQTLR